jgi:hypothetical protein
MKWLPARAYDKGIYVAFSNPIGIDDDQLKLKNVCSTIIDSFGDMLAECRSFDNEVAVAACVGEKLEASVGYRFKRARMPVLYRNILGADHPQRRTLHGCEREVKKAPSQVSIPLSAARQAGFMPSLVKAKS